MDPGSRPTASGSRTSSEGHGAEGTHAVVIGGSLAGLLAARVLADHFGRVTVIDRDHFPSGPEFRRGVPQSPHVHGLLVQGYRVLNELFPGLEADLVAAGAPRMDWLNDFPSLLLGDWSPRYPSDLVTHACSRNLLEFLIRRRLQEHPRLLLREGCEARGLIVDGGRAQVRGVRVQPRGEAGRGLPPEIYGDLVVDASGRGSHAPDWLREHGYPRPEETVINAFLGYATRWYRRPPDVGLDWKALVVSSKAPDYRRGAVIYPMEGDRWIVTLAGIARDYPPTDERGFLDFARSLRSPHVYEAIREAQSLTPIYGYQQTENRLRHYERLAGWPENFVVLGDAACAFNPVYGQGMTVAALGALTLRDLLRERNRPPSFDEPAGLFRHFQHKLAATIKVPWLMATGEDLHWPTTEGDRPDIGPLSRLLQRYVDQMLLVLPDSPPVHRTFAEVVHLVRPPAQLFRPGVMLRVAAHTLRPRRRPSINAPVLPVAKDRHGASSPHR